MSTAPQNSGQTAGQYPGAAAAMRLLARETRVSTGSIPHELAGVTVAPGTSCLADDCFLLRTEDGPGFFYRKGEGIVVAPGEKADPTEQRLWLDGSVYAAVACINGLLPIHASAVAHGGRVHAFTGPSGSGKSTLAAALGSHGLPLYADDTLILDLSDPEQLICLPGHKRLKLTSQAIRLTGATAREPVGAGIDKFYADVPQPPCDAKISPPLPLAELIFLEGGTAPIIAPISGGAGIVRLGEDHYTTSLYVQAQRLTRRDLFDLRARLARQIAMAALARPRDLTLFADSVALAARHIRA